MSSLARLREVDYFNDRSTEPTDPVQTSCTTTRIRAELTDFGLTERVIEETFAAYTARYNVNRDTTPTDVD